MADQLKQMSNQLKINNSRTKINVGHPEGMV